MASTSTSKDEIILVGPEQYHEWVTMIQGSVPRDLWPYVDPEDPGVFEAPEAPDFSTVHPGATELSQLSDAEKSQYFSLHTIYNHEMTRYHRFLSEEAKLRDKIIRTISATKRAQLKSEDEVWTWLKTLENSTKPSIQQMTSLVKARHRTLTGAKYNDWPTGGPGKWISEWQKIMVDCEKWAEPQFKDWPNDFILVWGEVPDVKPLCNKVADALDEDEFEENWSIYRIANELEKLWDQRNIRAGMKLANKSRIHKASFTTFDGESPPEPEPESEAGPSKQPPNQSVLATA